jgi:hypothetical protein
MTVKELIERLSSENPDEEVYFSYPSGDYWGTTCANEVSCVDTGQVKWSEYHGTYNIANEDYNDEYDDPEDLKPAIIIS